MACLISDRNYPSPSGYPGVVCWTESFDVGGVWLGLDAKRAAFRLTGEVGHAHALHLDAALEGHVERCFLGFRVGIVSQRCYVAAGERAIDRHRRLDVSGIVGIGPDHDAGVGNQRPDLIHDPLEAGRLLGLPLHFHLDELYVAREQRGRRQEDGDRDHELARTLHDFGPGISA